MGGPPVTPDSERPHPGDEQGLKQGVHQGPIRPATGTRVVYVAGTGRSGSTLLGNAIGSLPGALSVGEVKLGLRRGVAEGGSCGCRVPVVECPVWRPALEATFGAVPSPADALHIDAQLTAATRTRRVPWWLAGRTSDAVVELVDLFGRLLSELASVSGSSVLVDSSKLPAYGALLARSDQLDVRVVHLVRDPRAVAYSWQRTSASQQVAGFEEEMERFSPTKSSLMWLESSGSTLGLARRGGAATHVVRYEDLVADPAVVLDEIAAFAGYAEAERDLSFIGAAGLELRTSHAVAGNPNRVRSGPLTLRRDDEWVERLPAGQRRLVSAVTAPLRRTHGY